MGLEVPVYITDLVTTNPVSTDAVSAGDDHLRAIKTALAGTFTGFAGAAMSSTEAELNFNDGSIAGTSVASKTLVLGASKETDVLTLTTLTSTNVNTPTNTDLVVSPNGTGDVDFNACSIMIDTGESIKDAGGDEYIEFTESTTPVNHLGVESADTGVNIKLKALGEADSGITYENDQSEELFIMECTATAVNEFTSNNAATGAGPSLSATGGDTNIDINLIPKGSGKVNVQGGFIAGETTTGSNAHAVAITGAIHEFSSTGADALTLADGSEGQHLYIVCTSNAGGDATLTPSNLGGGTTLTFSTTDESCHLVFTNGNWYLMGGNGVAIA